MLFDQYYNFTVHCSDEFFSKTSTRPEWWFNPGLGRMDGGGCRLGNAVLFFVRGYSELLGHSLACCSFVALYLIVYSDGDSRYMFLICQIKTL